MDLIEFGDCRETMRRWAARGVRAQMCVTSPPYFGLRDYGHEGQLGLEQTPEQYVANMVDVFRCVRDVLADDGTLWLNIGDGYSSREVAQPMKNTKCHRCHGSGIESVIFHGVNDDGSPCDEPVRCVKCDGFGFSQTETIKPKDLIGIPWMLAFALRADGWFLRQDIIWHKPNPMPESVRDRCTKAHEYVFLLSKSERYFFDSEAMKEPAVQGVKTGQSTFNGVTAGGDMKTQSTVIRHGLGASTLRSSANGKRNRRSVWTVATRPYRGAHFATFPPALIEPCILAGSSPGDVVLDPFMGSGTTAAVALQHGRQYLGCELNPEYGPLQADRIGAAFGGIA